jgi:glycosyltransferase involved in cell wall biosynthesis
MNILVLAPHPFFQNRGTPIAVNLLLTALSENGHRVDVLTYPEGQDISLRNVTIIRVRKTFGIQGVPIGFSLKKVFYDILLFLRMLVLLRRNRYDLIHAVEESAFFAIAGKILYKTPYVFDMDSSIPDQILEKYPDLRLTHRLLRRIERIMIRRSIYVVAVCESLAKIARDWTVESRVAILEDVPLFAKREEGKSLGIAGALGIPGAIVMYVGNLETYQGIDLLLESFRIAHARDGRHHLVIVGGAESDIARYAGMASSMGIGGHVHFLGPKPIEDLPKYLAEADVLVSPRIRGENTPMKIYSYMFSGIPVLATRMPTHTQVLNDDNAVLADPVPERFADALCGLLEDIRNREAIGLRAIRDVEERYSYAVYKEKLARIYGVIAQDLGITVEACREMEPGGADPVRSAPHPRKNH